MADETDREIERHQRELADRTTKGSDIFEGDREAAEEKLEQLEQLKPENGRK